MQRWKPSGARLNARPWKEANNGLRIGFDGSYSNSSKRPITGAGSTALWGINHLWTSNKTTTKNGKDRVKYCDHKKGGREPCRVSLCLHSCPTRGLPFGESFLSKRGKHPRPS